jgi:hypothetical protein
MLRDENGQGDKDCQHEEQYGASDAAAPWRKIPRVVGAGHLQAKPNRSDCSRHLRRLPSCDVRPVEP